MVLSGPNATNATRASPGPRIQENPPANALPKLRIHKHVVGKDSKRIQGAITAYLTKQDELQKAQQSGLGTSTTSEDELRRRVKDLEAQLSVLLQKLQAGNAASIEQDQPQPLQTEGAAGEVDAAMVATSRTSMPPRATGASEDDSKEADSQSEKSSKSKDHAPRTPKPTVVADESASVRAEPQATKPHPIKAQDNENSMAPKTQSMVESGRGGSKEPGPRSKKKRPSSSTAPTIDADKNAALRITHTRTTDARVKENGTPPSTTSRISVGKANSVKAASQSAETDDKVNSVPTSSRSTFITGKGDYEGPAKETLQMPTSDTTTLAQQIQTQSKSMKSSSHPQSSSPVPQAPSTASDEVSEQSLLDELFPEASSQGQPDTPDKRPSPPKLDLPATDADPRIRFALSDGRTDREKAIDAFRARGEQTTILQLSNCSPALTESDFRRLIPRGLHIGTWSREGEFFKVIPGRDPLSLARLPIYYLLFRSSESALAYQKNASRLSKLSALHTPNSIHSAIMPPAGFLEDGEDIRAVTSSFVLHPQGHQLDLRTVMQPYNRALRALIDAGGYTPIVPNIDDKGKKIHRVLLHIDGYEPSQWDLWQIISRHAHARGILWPFRNEHAGALRRLRDCLNLKTMSRTKFQAVSMANPRAADSRGSSGAGEFDYEDAQISSFLGISSNGSQAEAQNLQETNQLVMNRVYNRWIVELDDEDAARRFAGLWHRVVLPDAKDKRGAWKEAEEERWVEAEYLW